LDGLCVMIELKEITSSAHRRKNNTSDEDGDLPLLMDKEELGEEPKNRTYRRPRRTTSSFVRTWQAVLQYSSLRAVYKKIKSLMKSKLTARTVLLNGEESTERFPPNTTRNQKYSFISFMPVVLYEQFKYFFNLYFLLVVLVQLWPPLRIGFMFSSLAPLLFVLSVTLLKEGFEDFKRMLRDREVNSEKFQRLTPSGLVDIPSSKIKVGHIIMVHTNQRVPADMVLLRTTENNGASFIRTDQLDGETDWKLRRAVSFSQNLEKDEDILSLGASVYAEMPKKDIYKFFGTISLKDSDGSVEPLSVENTLWANTVVASGTVIGLTIYTGKENRMSMNASAPSTKVGAVEKELNALSKVLFIVLVLLSFVMVALKGFHGLWLIYFFRFLLLFSAIIPVSMRVNLDMAKTVYSFFIGLDKKIPGTVARTSTIPEELGRIGYLLSDKTGTLTQNDMIFQKLHMGSMCFSQENISELVSLMGSACNESFSKSLLNSRISHIQSPLKNKLRVTMSTQLLTVIRAIALCHNVTPVIEEDDTITYQASSPDEVALVKFTESVGLTLVGRNTESITLRNVLDQEEDYEILNIFPFSSERKRMGIIIRDMQTDEIAFYLKGADMVMRERVRYSDWLDEECDNMAREGLRTLVFAKRRLSEEEYEFFRSRFEQASVSIQGREDMVNLTIESIENNMELLCLTGVEDKLQEGVKTTLETLRNAGIRTWMLTGDKIETATCIAISSKLVSRTQSIFTLTVTDEEEAWGALNDFAETCPGSSCLIIDGSSLQICLSYCKDLFTELAMKASSVVCCRCTPTQKADMVKLLKGENKRTCAIGDGGNDVSMIQEAHVGIGIVGKEGNQASLAADFSITQFSFLNRLILWHGRNSYRRSSRLSHFVIHRGLIISFIQAVFSSIFYFAPIAVYNGWLLVGYATIYTMAPVFSLVLDEDVSEDIAFRYPELYHSLQKGRELSYKTFFIWLSQSIYQGGTIMLLSIFLFSGSLINIVAITFTALIFAELFNVAFEIHTWNRYILISEIVTFLVYIASLFLLDTYFDITFILTWDFMWKSIIVTLVSCLPVYLVKYIKEKYDPPSFQKVKS